MSTRLFLSDSSVVVTDDVTCDSLNQIIQNNTTKTITISYSSFRTGNSWTNNSPYINGKLTIVVNHIVAIDNGLNNNYI